MILHTLTALLLVLPTLVTAAIFPPGTKVKMLDPKGFKRAMKSNVRAHPSFSPPHALKCFHTYTAHERRRVRRTVVRGESLYVPSPGPSSIQNLVLLPQHCKQMAPEYSKAAGNLSPLVPFYAVDCDADSNRQLCASQVSKRACVMKRTLTRAYRRYRASRPSRCSLGVASYQAKSTNRASGRQTI